MKTIWSFLCDPFGRKRIAELEKEIETIKASRPLYCARTNYMESLAIEFAKVLPNIPEVHPDIRAIERQRVAMQMARNWINELDKGAPGVIQNG